MGKLRGQLVQILYPKVCNKQLDSWECGYYVKSWNKTIIRAGITDDWAECYFMDLRALRRQIWGNRTSILTSVGAIRRLLTFDEGFDVPLTSIKGSDYVTQYDEKGGERDSCIRKASRLVYNMPIHPYSALQLRLKMHWRSDAGYALPHLKVRQPSTKLRSAVEEYKLSRSGHGSGITSLEKPITLE
ncbi:hypothetical protein LR48_Vigan04g147700 [Vigna angularis]|uniref:Uncharacterized protein n=1 Tax=Phaseolus angularis TaxID=3914 RepID=A0A0L9UFF0_PHAAN|nr:hypothetical protein LR48_Vigan04g147700 [Vigna angularis]